MTRLRGALAWLGLVLGVVAPIVAAVSVIDSSRSVGAPEVPAVWVAAEEAEGGIEMAAALSLEWGDIAPAPSPSWEGLVEEVLVAPGTKVDTGTPVAWIGGILRLATADGRPIGRQLRLGDSGRDVESLHASLTALGYRPSSGSVFGPQTESAVRRLAVRLTGTESAVFDPAWFVFLPGGVGEASSVALAVGHPAPAAGAPVIEFRPTLHAAWAVADGGAVTGPAASEPEDAAPEGAPAPAAASPRLHVEPGAVFVVRDDEIPLEEGGDVAAGALPLVAALAGPSPGDTLAGLVRQAAPTGAVRVPTAAVFSGARAATCVRTRRRTLPVAVVDTYLGSTLVTGLSPSDEVQIAPPSDARRRCR